MKNPLAFILALAVSLSACAAPAGTGDIPTPSFTTSPALPSTSLRAGSAGPSPTPFVLYGPGPYAPGAQEAAPALPFPTQLTLAQAVSGLAKDISLPSSFNTDSALMREIRDTIAIHQSWCNLDAPCTGTLRAVYSETYHRWTTAAMDNNGNITEWMLIHTDTGDHWAEQPFWDSLLAGKTTAEINKMIRNGEIEFILPPHTVDASHFEAMWQNGFLILVEVDKNGNPFQWNTLNRGMQIIVGAETPTPAAPEWQKAEYSGDLIICPNTQKPEDVLPNRSYQVQIEGQTVEINPQQYMIGLTIRDTERQGKNAAEISALEAKYLSQDKTFDAWIRIANRAYVFSHAEQIGLNPADVVNQSDEQIFWEVIQLSQLNHQVLIPNPLEIRSWYQDYSLSFDSSDGSKSYDGIFASERIGRGNPNPLEYNISYGAQKKSNYPVFGITIEVPRATYRGVLGRQAALFVLPGWSPEQMIMSAVYYQGPDGKTYLHYLTAALTPEAAMIHQGDFYRTNSWGFDESQLFFADRDYNYITAFRHYLLRDEDFLTLNDFTKNLGNNIYAFDAGHGPNYGPANPPIGQVFYGQFGIEGANFIQFSDFLNPNTFFPWEPTPAPATPTP
ncbi:MAG: hypothetical protein L6300_12150 [Syntrophaceae bacterium]|nr:hypothetical protein [Nanoarchaeota archaeon]MCG2740967.1 hypothetical protein [Syntrophaceae bacterium]